MVQGAQDDSYGSPDANYTTPDFGYHTPDHGKHSPDLGYHAPDDGFMSPDGKISSPDTEYQPPDPEYQSPDDHFHSPEAEYDTPDDLHQKPDLSKPEPQLPTAYPPIVKTFKLPRDASAPYQFQGRVLTDGGAALEEVGFIFSRSIFFRDSVRVIALLNQSTNEFSVTLDDFEPGKTYYYRAFGRNRAGETEGARKKLKVPERVISNSWWSESQAVGGGWRSSDWFGQFRLYPGVDWTFHAEWEWIYPSSDGTGGIWFWKEGEGWLWTKRDSWPYLWRNNSGSWLYYFGERQGGPLFWDYQSRTLVRW